MVDSLRLLRAQLRIEWHSQALGSKGFCKIVILITRNVFGFHYL